jgi:hypothetical protein
MRRGLTAAWSIDISAEFIGRVIEGELQLVAPGRTIWIAVWTSPPESAESPTATLSWIKQDVDPNPDQRFEETGADQHELRYASWYREVIDGRQQFGLYGYTIRQGTFVQAAFLTDDPEDLQWALDAWRSLRYQSQP